MLIDHTGYFFKYQWNISPVIYFIMHLIGRLAFPLFAFLVVESYYHTKHKVKHGMRILLIALISEIPFNLLYTHGYPFDKLQNVCFELFIGYCMISAMNISFVKRETRVKDEALKFIIDTTKKLYPFICYGITFIVSILINSDYSFMGITLMALFNIAHNAKPFKCGNKTFDVEISRNFYITIAVSVFISMMYNPLYAMCYLDMLLLYVATSKLFNKTNDKFVVPNKMAFVLRYFYPLHLVFLILFRLALSL